MCNSSGVYAAAVESDRPPAALRAWADASPQAVDGEPPEKPQPVSHGSQKANERADASCAFGHHRCDVVLDGGRCL